MSLETELILADAHVHIHKCFDLAETLDGAHRNFSAISMQFSNRPRTAGVLFLTESASANSFQQMVTGGHPQTGACWRFEKTEEPISLVAIKDGRTPIVIVAGRQIVTAERLEVLALGAADNHPDGRPIRDTLNSVVSANAIPVIPWGFGKWMGRRGKILHELLADPTVPPFFLGDNGGRPAFMPGPSEFGRTRADAAHILPGSDPLPFPSESGKPGSFGFFIRMKIDLEHPMESLRSAIWDPATDLHGFGTPETVMRFIHHQVKMQIRIRQRKRA